LLVVKLRPPAHPGFTDLRKPLGTMTQFCPPRQN
jgi:hypothetical protein